MAVAFWELAELVTMLFHPRRRAVHDLIAGTVVVQTVAAAERKGVRRTQRVALAIIGLVVITALSPRVGRPYRSRFSDETLQGEYIPRESGSGPKLVIYWPDGKVRHVLAASVVKDSKPRQREKTWQSFDESGALTRDVTFVEAPP